jgi:hypothetical protein
VVIPSTTGELREITVLVAPERARHVARSGWVRQDTSRGARGDRTLARGPEGRKDPDMPRRFADLKHNVFARHSNPWSAWTRWLSTPLVLVPLWTRRWSHAAIVGAWMAANPVIFPKPADEHAWSTRVVLGEELWITERPRDTAMAVNAAATLAGITALIAARRRRAAPAAGATAVMMALLLVYWRLMADYYSRHRGANTG